MSVPFSGTFDPVMQACKGMAGLYGQASVSQNPRIGVMGTELGFAA